MASKRAIYLTKNKVSENVRNVFVFNENGNQLTAQWAAKNVEKNDGVFLIMDHDNKIFDATQSTFERKEYMPENFPADGIQINPFDLIKNSSESHFLFLAILYAMWDNNDPDIAAMSNLIDAFASAVTTLFQNNKAKLNMFSMKNMVKSVKSICKTPTGEIQMSDALFEKMDHTLMPYKYYDQFKKAAGTQKAEIENKVFELFNMFTDKELEAMRTTDESLSVALKFESAFFVNVTDSSQERSARVMMILLNHLAQKTLDRKNVFVLFDCLESEYRIISLPYWLKEAESNNMSYAIFCDNIAEFQASENLRRYFKGLQENLDASVLVHTKKKKKDETPPDSFEALMNTKYKATLLIPKEQFKNNDEMF